MRAFRLFIALFVLLACEAASAAEEMTFRFAGSEAGKNTYQEKPDGSFESVTDLTIAGIKITSRMTGRFKDGLLTDYDLTQSQAGTEMQVTASAGKVKVTAGGETSERDYKPIKLLRGGGGHR